MLSVVAPASMARSTTSARNSSSVRAASSVENSTSSHFSRASFTPSTARRTISSFAILSLKSRWMGLVARKTWMRFFGASLSAFQEASMSPLLQRERLQIAGPSSWRAMAWMASKSPGDAAAKPASITSTPSSASAFATRSFWDRFIDAPGDCSPSRSVVSKTTTRSWPGSLTGPLPFLSGAGAPSRWGESLTVPELPETVTGLPTAQMGGGSMRRSFDMRSPAPCSGPKRGSRLSRDLFGRGSAEEVAARARLLAGPLPPG